MRSDTLCYIQHNHAATGTGIDAAMASLAKQRKVENKRLNMKSIQELPRLLREFNGIDEAEVHNHVNVRLLRK